MLLFLVAMHHHRTMVSVEHMLKFVRNRAIDMLDLGTFAVHHQHQ